MDATVKQTSGVTTAAVTFNGKDYTAKYGEKNGWVEENGKKYWYEKGVKQGTTGRGKEIYDPDSDAWYWLDAVQGGAMTVSKDVYQESAAGQWADKPMAPASGSVTMRTATWSRAGRRPIRAPTT